MSGPVTPADTSAGPEPPAGPSAGPAAVEVLDSREATVGGVQVRRALPRRTRRTVGPWCFADHMGPVAVRPDQGVDVGPHPHCGLQTVTWLLAGEVLHRDSLGSEQLVRAGQLNLMTAGRGVSHAEEATGRYRGDLHGIQLWVAQPESTRHGAPAFEHHADLPRVELPGVAVTVIVGALAGVSSPARRDTDHLGAELVLAPGSWPVPVRPGDEHAVVVLRGVADIDGVAVGPGHLAYLRAGRDEIVLGGRDGPATAMLLGGRPFGEEVRMWWNFVARTPEELDDAQRAWQADDGRFGHVTSRLGRIDAPRPPWWTPSGG